MQTLLETLDARIAAAYEQLVYTARVAGMASWENTADGSGYRGSYDRLDEGRGFCAELRAYADTGWKDASLEDMLTALNDALDAGLQARRDLRKTETRINEGCDAG